MFSPLVLAIAWLSDQDPSKHQRNPALGIHFGAFLDKIWTLAGAREGPWDHPGAPLGPEPPKHQKNHVVELLF